jgi:predicted nucleic acid-binding protein
VSAGALTGVYLDTSALYAVFDADDRAHEAAARAWEELLGGEASLHTGSYVLVETTALLQRRLGIAAVDAFTTFVLPWVRITWIDESLHAQAVSGLLAAGRRDLTLVDCAGFVLMRRLGLRTAFTLDRHFAEQGFEVLPAADRPGTDRAYPPE